MIANGVAYHNIHSRQAGSSEAEIKELPGLFPLGAAWGRGNRDWGGRRGGDKKPSCFPPVPAVASPSFLTLSSLVADSIFTPPFPLISMCLEHPFLFCGGEGLLLYVEDDLILRAC